VAWPIHICQCTTGHVQFHSGQYILLVPIALRATQDVDGDGGGEVRVGV